MGGAIPERRCDAMPCDANVKIPGMGGISDPREILFKNVCEEGPWALGEIGEIGEISFK